MLWYGCSYSTEFDKSWKFLLKHTQIAPIFMLKCQFLQISTKFCFGNLWTYIAQMRYNSRRYCRVRRPRRTAECDITVVGIVGADSISARPITISQSSILLTGRNGFVPYRTAQYDTTNLRTTYQLYGSGTLPHFQLYILHFTLYEGRENYETFQTFQTF